MSGGQDGPGRRLRVGGRGGDRPADLGARARRIGAVELAGEVALVRRLAWAVGTCARGGDSVAAVRVNRRRFQQASGVVVPGVS